MSTEHPDERSTRSSARRDIAIVAGISLLAALACIEWNLSEALAAWTRPRENWQLDEWPGILLVVAVCLVWFSSRRYREAKRQLAWRKQAETKLAESLQENQRLALKYVDMQEQERKTLAHDLHDELGQYVNAIKLDAVAMRQAVDGNLELRGAARAMIANLDRVYDVLRGLIGQLRPVGLDDLGLVAALEHCTNEWRSRLPRAQIELDCGTGLDTLDEARAMVVFRLVQEGLTNVARHAQATHVRIQIARTVSASGLDIVIADNGQGADLRPPRSGLGLVGMRERVAALGGSIALTSAPGAGFIIAVFLPLTRSG